MIPETISRVIRTQKENTVIGRIYFKTTDQLFPFEISAGISAAFISKEILLSQLIK